MSRDTERNGFATATSAWLVNAEKVPGNTGLYNETEAERKAEDDHCDRSLTFDSLEELAKSSDKMAPDCAQVHALITLRHMLTESTKKYDSEKRDYEKKFSYFQDAFRDSARAQLDKFMLWPNGDGLKFFTCHTVTSVGKRVSSGRCPLKGIDVGGQALGTDIEYELNQSEEFFGELKDKTGIEQEWIEMTTWTDTIVVSLGTGIKMNGPKSTQNITHKFRNGPRLKSKFAVPNPKEVVESAMGSVDHLRNILSETALEMSFNVWLDSREDTVTAFSLPVFMIVEAVNGMHEVKEIGGKVQQRRDKEKALEIAGWVLLLVPMAGEIGAAFVGLLNLGRIFAGLGFAGNLGVATAGAVINPDNAIFGFMGVVLQGLPIRGTRGVGKDQSDSMITKAAQTARTFLTGRLAKGPAGERLQQSHELLQRVVGVCRRKY